MPLFQRGLPLTGGTLTGTLNTPMVVAGPATGFGTAYAVTREGVQVGRLDNNQVSGGGMRVQALTGVLQLRGSANLGILIDNATITANLPFILGSASPPASATAPGTAGQLAWDTGFLYVCTATNTWKRVEILTW